MLHVLSVPLVFYGFLTGVGSQGIENHKHSVIDGIHGQKYEIDVDKYTEIVIQYPKTNDANPYRIISSSETASKKHPILVTVQQEQQILSWQIPMKIKILPKLLFMQKVSRTICYDEDEHSLTKEQLQNGFNLHIWTASPTHLRITIETQPIEEYYLRKGVNYSAVITPSEPAVYYFSINKTENRNTSFIAVSSSDDVCLTVSIQDSICPVRVSDSDIQHQGKYQSMINKGGLFIRANEFPNGYFLVFVAKGDDTECTKNLLPSDEETISKVNRTTTVNFILEDAIHEQHYLEPVMIIFGVNLAICTVAVLAAIIALKLRNFWGLCLGNRTATENGTQDNPHLENDVDAPQRLYNIQNLTVMHLVRDEENLGRKSENFLWYTVNIGLFYSIPVAQLMISHQKYVNTSGNTDMCYHNFYCSRPYGIFSDFNHIYSNIGYVMFGITFLGITLFRRLRKPHHNGMGIPRHYGIYFAMGIALILEGLMSGFYHICPTQLNFQFDTSFMYIMSVLCLVKIYQNRHPELNVGAYGTFTLLGLVVFIAMLGIVLESVIIMGTFVAIYLIMCVYMSIKIYFLGHFKEGFLYTYNLLRGGERTVPVPLRKHALVVILIVDIFSLVLCTVSIVNGGNFASFILNIFLGNLGIYFVYYLIMKLINGERICVEAIVYLILAIVMGPIAGKFYEDASTDWSRAPAESKVLNKQCYWMDFYDTHDIWHLASAPTLFFSFLVFQCLDDDLIEVPQTDINVF